MNTLALLDSDDDMIDSNITIVEKMEQSFTEVTRNTTFDSPKCRSSLNRFPSRKRNLAEARMSIRRREQMTIYEDLDDTENKASCSLSFESPTLSKTPIRPRSFSVTDVNTMKAESPVRIHSLPTLLATGSVPFGRIEAATLISLMRSGDFFEKYIIIDCRYPYEYEGGHIKGAVNLFDPEMCSSLFYNAEGRTEMRIPILHCEFSQKRGPAMASTLRQVDRHRNHKNYPHRDFPELYVLDGGYKGFYENYKDSEHQDLFAPKCSYTAMSDKTFSENLKKFTFHKSERVKAHTLAKKPSSRRHLALRRRNFVSSPTIGTPTSRNLFESDEMSIPFQESPASRPMPFNLSFS